MIGILLTLELHGQTNTYRVTLQLVDSNGWLREKKVLQKSNLLKIPCLAGKHSASELERRDLGVSKSEDRSYIMFTNLLLPKIP